MSIARADVTGAILCGGRGRRMGGADKGLVEYAGRPLVLHAIERLAPQVATLVINANRNLERYRAFAHDVVTDATADFDGPLAGLAAVAQASRTDWLASVPCDLPLLPEDLVARLASALDAQRDAAVAIAVSEGRAHPVCALMHRRTALGIGAWLARGDHRVLAFMRDQGLVEVAFDDCPGTFRNLNTPDDLGATAPA